MKGNGDFVLDGYGGDSWSGLEDMNFKFSRCGRIFEYTEVDDRAFAEAMTDLEKASWAQIKDILKKNGLETNRAQTGPMVKL